MTKNCPCGSGRSLADCCGPILSGERLAPTAEALMRSRYSAYVQKNVEYILSSCDDDARAEVDEDATRDWAERTDWLQLEIVDTSAGGEQDQFGEVEFVARFRDEKGREHKHHELSTFVRKDGRWYYHDGDIKQDVPVTRSAPKVGRNDACPCGSGKKYKKCCGANA
jgi:SEC-C motif-containing protein